MRKKKRGIRNITRRNRCLTCGAYVKGNRHCRGERHTFKKKASTPGG